MPRPSSTVWSGEIVKRTENLLTVDVGGGELRTVEVVPDAEVIIPGMEGVGRADQLKHHLEIQRMSKSKGNVVNPDDWVSKYGADTRAGVPDVRLRLAEGWPLGQQRYSGCGALGQ